jgi:hypothetical protein
MSSPIVGLGESRLQVQPTLPRQTERPASNFRDVLLTGADVLLAGAGIAGGLFGGPVLSAAIGAVREGVARARTPASGTPISGTSSGGTTAGSLSSSGASGSSGTSGTSELEAMKELQREGQKANLVYLQLQEQVAQDNRRYSTASNLLKARHDTARSAISNLRV